MDGFRRPAHEVDGEHLKSRQVRTEVANQAMNWIGAIFLAALITVAVAIYSDARMTRCEPKSFAAVAGLCTVQPR